MPDLTITVSAPSFAYYDAAEAHAAHIAAMLKDRDGDADALREAARQLDVLWDMEAVSGWRDSHGSAEYQRLSTAPRLRDLADLIDPQDGGVS
jgi:hypothetical protein